MTTRTHPSTEPLPFRRVLVANRGEIARRVIRSCRDRGLETVSVFSDADRGAPHVDEATYAVALGGTSSAESYLDVAKVLDAAARAGADAVHPGYGFLSENPEFAEAVAAAGLTWIGPTPESMRAMALKVEAKRLAAAAGVPLVPGAELAADVSDDELARTAAAVGFPLLVKASAGGGGKGMRVVRDPADLVEAVEGARREAASSFGDPTVFLERYLERSRHVEVQVFGDVHGDVVHLFERECSIQRRHQKVVEEAPSPGATAATLEPMYAAAVSLAQAIGYVGAGTVEFLVSGEGQEQEFFFLEMNTRLQVEHPVTEETTGLDLVAWQLDVAAGRPLPLRQDEIGREGHAIEVRLYAEDPANGFLPSTGTLTSFELDRLRGVRVDSAVVEGDVVSPYYDPMLAKAIVHAPTREAAASALADALSRSGISGVTTNAAMLAAVLRSQAFLEGDTTTAFLDEHPELLVPAVDPQVRRRQLLVAGLLALDPGGVDVEGSTAPPPSGWRNPAGPPSGWRNVPGTPELVRLRYRDGAEVRTAVVARAWRREGARLWSALDIDGLPPAASVPDDERFTVADGVRVDAVDPWVPDLLGEARVEIDGVRRAAQVSLDAGVVLVGMDGVEAEYTVVPPWDESSHGEAGGGPATPVPGTVTHVAVAVGDTVSAGDALVVLEAMKMEHTIRADVDGVVAEVLVGVGQSVDAHTVVVTLVAEGEEAS